eukprot:362598-Chlamydomonas_euryale.AAC.4
MCASRGCAGAARTHLPRCVLGVRGSASASLRSSSARSAKAAASELCLAMYNACSSSSTSCSRSCASSACLRHAQYMWGAPGACRACATHVPCVLGGCGTCWVLRWLAGMKTEVSSGREPIDRLRGMAVLAGALHGHKVTSRV